MTRRLLIVSLIALIPVAALAQVGAGATVDLGSLSPCMAVGGQFYTPVADDAMQNVPTVTLDGVAMAVIGSAMSPKIVKTDAGKYIELSAAGKTVRLAVLSPGNFWLHPTVRQLIPVYRRQPVPRWPYVDANFPSTAPFGVNWKRPYLDWKPDEAWLAAMLAPPVIEEPEPVVLVEEEAAPEEPAAAPTAAPAPGGMGMGMGMDPAMAPPMEGPPPA